MNWNRPDMTETVKSENYTNKPLQKDSNPTTMEVVTQTNAVKSPTDSPKTTKLVYTVEEIARMLAISLRSAYNLCNRTTEFRVLQPLAEVKKIYIDDFGMVWAFTDGIGVTLVNPKTLGKCWIVFIRNCVTCKK